MDSILKKVVKRITPSKSEIAKVESIINLSKSLLTSQLSKMGINAEVFVGGSIAKGTWIKGDYDVDLFVRFKGYKDEEIGNLLVGVVKRAFGRCEIMHGSRNYCKLKFNGCNLEIIPVMKVNSPSDAKNSMDASIFHVNYIKNKISHNPKLADEIRLFKMFAKAHNVYGAETHISGISGYVSELLMIHFGSFKNLVNQSCKLKPPVFIDIENHYKSFYDAKRQLSKPKISSPIVLIDPVMKSRNASASLNYTTFANLVLALRMFRKKPSLSAFRKKKISIADLKERSKKRGTLFVAETIKIDSQKEDIFFAKLNKILKRINSSIEREDIDVYDYGYLSDGKSVKVYFELSTLKLSKMKKHYGPPVWVPKEHFDIFVSKWKKVYIDGINLVADVKRRETDVKRIVKALIKKGIKNAQ